MKNVFFLLIVGTGLIWAQSFELIQNSLTIKSEAFQHEAGGSTPEKIMAYLADRSLDDVRANLAHSQNGAPVSKQIIRFIPGKFRMDMTEKGEKLSYLMHYDGASARAYVVRWGARQYMTIDMNKMKQMQARMKSALAGRSEQMKAMMKNLPPESRAQMEKMLGMRKESPPVVKKTGRDRNINGFHCVEYRIKEDNKLEQYWITEEKPFVRKAFEQLIRLFSALDRKKDLVMEQIPSGWPVVNKQVGQGFVTLSEITSVTQKSFSETDFNPPAGFKEQNMDMLMNNPFGTTEQ
ncbi:MAG: DUF4412 domain-containing protein [Calditrichaeota bacterium]|nr:MAG: DUF4412 domain-containing protein [Calditrichota bacterium]